MTILKRRSPIAGSDRDEEVVETESYIDLSDMMFENEGDFAAQMHVKVGEVYRYEDISTLTSHVYDGNLVIIDITSVANDELTLRRITTELKNVVRDINGDVAGIGKNLLMVTPTGVKIDRNKIRGGF